MTILTSSVYSILQYYNNHHAHIEHIHYTIEQILEGISRNPGWKRLLEETDTLIDGPFLLEEKTLTLKFRGSRNQRVIDPAASLQEGRAVEKEF